MFHVKHVRGGQSDHNTLKRLLVVAALCTLIACFLCACQASPSFERGSLGGSILSETTGYLSELAEETALPDSMFELGESTNGEDEGYAADDEPTSDAQPAASKPKITLPNDIPGAEYEEHTILVTPAQGVSADEVAEAMGVDASQISEAGMGYYSVSLPSETSAQEALEALQDASDIAAAQPDFVYHLLDEQADTGSEKSAEPQNNDEAVASAEGVETSESSSAVEEESAVPT